MKYDIDSDKINFRPFDVTITFENKDEFYEFLCRLNVSRTVIKDAAPDYLKFEHDNYDDLWHSLDCFRRDVLKLDVNT
jgi:hypothetical protein